MTLTSWIEKEEALLAKARMLDAVEHPTIYTSHAKALRMLRLAEERLKEAGCDMTLAALDEIAEEK